MRQVKTQLAILGAGPGGYTAAFYAADLGMEVTLIDMADGPGGVCLYAGCIPSKVFLHVAKVLFGADDIVEFGVTFTNRNVDIDKLRAKKNQIVAGLADGLKLLGRKRNIHFIRGNAVFSSPEQLSVTSEDEEEIELTFNHLIVAAGSRPATIPGAIDSPRVIDSTGALLMESIPEKMLVVGGGYIGVELGQVYASLGSAITMVEMAPGLLPGADRDLVRFLDQRLKKHFREILLEAKVVAMKDQSDGITVDIETKTGVVSRQFDKVLIAVGRKPNIDRLNLDRAGIAVNEHGFIQINRQRQTSVPTIFAIGDIAGQPMLAHKAAYEAKVAVEAIAEKKTEFDPKAIPCVIFTDPEIAWCGLTETQAINEKLDVKIARFPWEASGRAATQARKDGLTKLIVDAKTEMILGVGIAGQGAGEMIAEGVLAMEMGAGVEDLSLTIHAHPTFSETIMESAESFFNTSTHLKQ